MKWFLSTVACAILCSTKLFAADLQLNSGGLVAITGDSITEQKFYSVFIEDYLLMCQPVTKVQATQFGWGGETSWGFFSRIESDCLVFKPTVATTFYGMNDGGYGPLSKERRNQYHDAMHNIVKAFKKSGVRTIVLGSPGVVDTFYFRKTPGQPVTEAAKVYNKSLAELGEIARDVAAEEHVGYADIHAAMAEAMERSKSKLGQDYEFAGGDGVHPGPNGHLVTAYAFLKALGCDGNIGTITFDAGASKAEASEGHKIVSADSTAIEVESTRYPFCFIPPTDKAWRAGKTSEIVEFFPFNQDLNRFVLIVKNAPADKMKVTWGKSSKDFSRAALEAGVNLAAEFMDNPFCAAFEKVHAAVQKQQNWETPAIKDLLHRIPQYRQLLPEQSAAFDNLVGPVVNRDATLRQDAAAALVPVRHTIKIESAP